MKGLAFNLQKIFAFGWISRRSRNRVGASELQEASNGSPRVDPQSRLHSSRTKAQAVGNMFGWRWNGSKKGAQNSGNQDEGSWTLLPRLRGYRAVVDTAKQLTSGLGKLVFVGQRNSQEMELRQAERAFAEATANWASERVQCQVRDIAATSQRVSRVATLLSIRHTEALINALRSEAQRRIRESKAQALYKKLVEAYAKTLSQSEIESVMAAVFSPEGLKRLVRLRDEMVKRQDLIDRVYARWKRIISRLEQRQKMQLYLKGMYRAPEFWSNFDQVRNRRIEASAAIKWCLNSLNTRRRRALHVLTQQSLVFGLQRSKVHQKWNTRLFRANKALQPSENKHKNWIHRRAQARANYLKKRLRGRREHRSVVRTCSSNNLRIVVGITQCQNNKLCGYGCCQWNLVSQPLIAGLCEDPVSDKKRLHNWSSASAKQHGRTVGGCRKDVRGDEHYSFRVDSVLH